MVLDLGSVDMAFLCSVSFIAVSVRMSTVAVAVIVEKEESNNVRGQSETSYDKHELGLADFLRLDETLDSVKEDGKAKCDEEDTVYECTEGFSALPLCWSV